MKLSKQILSIGVIALSALLFSCGKDSASIRVAAVIVEAITNEEIPATNAVIKLYQDGELKETANTNSAGIITFSKLPKGENWQVQGSYKLNGINYNGAATDIKTDGRSASIVSLKMN